MELITENHKFQFDPACGCGINRENYDKNGWCSHDNHFPWSGYSSRWHKLPDYIDLLSRVAEIDAIVDNKSVSSWIMEHGDSDYSRVLYVETPKQKRKREQEETRIKLEASAAMFASSHNVKPNSIAFIKAVKKEIKRLSRGRDHWNNPEVRMEEWAAHMYNGTRECYFDDLNFENGRFDSDIRSLRAILEWLETACPLLMAKYKEARLAKK